MFQSMRVHTNVLSRSLVLVFCRSGTSTFQEEMMETANMLNHATCSSLVVIDELGRGTSTYDGCAIAYATLHHLLDRVKARALFATHHHALVRWIGTRLVTFLIQKASHQRLNSKLQDDDVISRWTLVYEMRLYLIYN